MMSFSNTGLVGTKGRRDAVRRERTEENGEELKTEVIRKRK
jgi:hypothetical protein